MIQMTLPIAENNDATLERACVVIDKMLPWVNRLIADNEYFAGHARRVVTNALGFLAAARGRTSEAIAIAEFQQTESDKLRQSAEETAKENESLRNRLHQIEEIAKKLLACRQATGGNDVELYQKMDAWVNKGKD